MVAEIHVGDAGTAIRLHLIDQDGKNVDVSAASVIEITFLSPASRRLVVAAAPVTDGKDGRVQYVPAEEDFDVAGSWRLQARTVIGTGRWRSNVIRFPVASNL